MVEEFTMRMKRFTVTWYALSDHVVMVWHLDGRVINLPFDQFEHAVRLAQQAKQKGSK